MTGIELVVEPAGEKRQNHRVQVDSTGCVDGDYITLTENFPKGVKALWCRSDKKIKTFLFDKDVFSIDQAKAWAKEHSDWKGEMPAGDETPFEKVIYSALGDGVKPLLFVASSPAVAKLGLTRNQEGSIRKEILRTGKWAAVPSGGDAPLELSAKDLEAIKSAFDDKAVERVVIPLEHSRSPLDNTGFVQSLEIAPCVDGSGETGLYGWLKFTESHVEEGVLNGTIWAVSCWIHGPYMRPGDGKIYPLVLRHVALVDAPFVEGMEPFVKEQAMASNQLFLRYEGGEDVGKGKEKTTLTLEGADLERYNTLLALDLTAEELGAFKGLKLTPEQLEAYKNLELSAEEITAIVKRSKDLAEQEKGVFARERALAVTNVVLALEGKTEVEGVHKEDGHRHFPVVVKKVEELLKGVPFGAVSIKLSRDGKDPEEVSVDSLILEVVNSLPKEARVVLGEEDPIPFRGKKPGDESKPEDLEDKQVMAYLESQGLPISEEFRKRVEGAKKE